MHCPNCGAANGRSNEFRQECGASLTDAKNRLRGSSSPTTVKAAVDLTDGNSTVLQHDAFRHATAPTPEPPARAPHEPEEPGCPVAPEQLALDTSDGTTERRSASPMASTGQPVPEPSADPGTEPYTRSPTHHAEETALGLAGAHGKTFRASLAVVIRRTL